jgi:mono/diheme cytochrome c family protein
MRVTIAAAQAAALLGFGLATAALANGDEAAEAGHRLVAAQCAACHSVEASGASPLAAAPPFRVLHERYPVEELAEALAEGIVTGHREMPEFAFEPDEVEAIITYLKTLAP